MTAVFMLGLILIAPIPLWAAAFWFYCSLHDFVIVPRNRSLDHDGESKAVVAEIVRSNELIAKANKLVRAAKCAALSVEMDTRHARRDLRKLRQHPRCPDCHAEMSKSFIQGTGLSSSCTWLCDCKRPISQEEIQADTARLKEIVSDGASAD